VTVVSFMSKRKYLGPTSNPEDPLPVVAMWGGLGRSSRHRVISAGSELPPAGKSACWTPDRGETGPSLVIIPKCLHDENCPRPYEDVPELCVQYVSPYCQRRGTTSAAGTGETALSRGTVVRSIDEGKAVGTGWILSGPYVA